MNKKKRKKPIEKEKTPLNQDLKKESEKIKPSEPPKASDKPNPSKTFNKKTKLDPSLSLHSSEDLIEQKESNESEKLKTTEKELKNFQEKYLYLRAEFDNYKRHIAKEQIEIKKYGSQALVTSLLNILDIFDQALSITQNENLESFKKGIEMTSLEFKNTLKNHGIQEVACEKGLPFDPKVHEALSHENSSDVPPGHILKVYRKAYKFHDRLLRPAQVIVAKEEKSHLKEKAKENHST